MAGSNPATAAETGENVTRLTAESAARLARNRDFLYLRQEIARL